MQEKERFRHVEVQFPLVLVKTRRGIGLMDRVAKFKATQYLGSFYLYIMPVITAIMFYIGIAAIYRYVHTPSAVSFVRSLGPAVNILLPGLNPILPIFYGWIALFFAMIVHEASHGIMARRAGLTVKDSGLLFFLVVPIGAFVELDEEQLKKERPSIAGRILAAGVGSNLASALIFLFLLLLVVSTFAPVSQYNGVGIAQVNESAPAGLAGLHPGELIVSVNGTSISNLLQLQSFLEGTRPGEMLVMQVADGSSLSKVNITLASNPLNSSIGYIGIGAVDSPTQILHSYLGAWRYNPTAYIPPPTLFGNYIPFSSTMEIFYTSPLGSAATILANLFYWLWFINFNLALFNALPIYPFDGGLAFRHMLRAAKNSTWDDKSVKLLTNAVTIAVVIFVVTMVLLPYVL
ncbi:MAG: site-2 protease family protein [Conexivisphaerales archaeon]